MSSRVCCVLVFSGMDFSICVQKTTLNYIIFRNVQTHPKINKSKKGRWGKGWRLVNEKENL
jgi:hypothetical protein